jgi:hypothetical protein
VTVAYPGLARLCRAYLDEAFLREAGPWQGAVLRFLEDEPPALVAQARSEVASLCHRQLGERDLSDLFSGSLGCRYWPLRDGISFSIWLKQLADTLLARPDPGAT